MSKRLRSLASLLWDTDDPPVAEGSSNDVEALQSLQKENELLKKRVCDLELLVCRDPVPKPLTSQVAPHVHGPLRPNLLASWPGQAWLASVRDDVLCLPRLQGEILPQLHQSRNAKERILFDLCPSPKATASTILEHSRQKVMSLFKKYPAVYKIGITCNPVQRWCHPKYGYGRDRRQSWQAMKILFVCDTSLSAALIESALIQTFRDSPGCRNYNPGGETPSPEQGPHFTYVVFDILLPPIER